MSAITPKNQKARLSSTDDRDYKPAVCSHKDNAEPGLVSNVPVRKNSKSDTIQKKHSGSVARQSYTIEKLKQGVAEWSLLKRKILFFYELIFISLCCVLGATVIFCDFPLLLKVGALAFLWGTARVFRKHVTGKF